MKNKAYDLSSYSFHSGEQVLVDTNVWLYLFPAPGKPPHNFAPQYSIAFKNLVSAQAQPVLDPMVLSEYLNRYIRIEWGGSDKSQYPKFKDFRSSPNFSAVASAAEIFAKKILTICQVHSIPASELDLNRALADFSAGGVDFNDAILVDICKRRNLKLMTNDGDFQDGGIEVLTANPRLLRSCT
jgi:predicted nucleic acid-binding protein